MRIKVNDVSLYFDVDGAGLVPDGPQMREKPTVILLHGGPGADHSLFKPRWSALSDIAQIIYVDHRGNGRSDDGNPSDWTLAQWGDDIRGLCDALEIRRPIVCGVSFGGFVAQSYATRHADHIGGLILISTAAQFDFDAMLDAFEAKGGPEARAAAAGYWLNPTAESRARYGEVCFPLYYQGEVNADAMSRLIFKNPVALHFNGAPNEMGQMDFRPALAAHHAPTLILEGEDDPITPPAFTKAIHQAMPKGVSTLKTYANCGHGVVEDRPDVLDDIRAFINATTPRIA